MIEINEMVIRVQGMNEQDAAKLGSEVAERLAADLSVALTDLRHIKELNLQLSMAPGTAHSDMAQTIAGKLLQQLNTML